MNEYACEFERMRKPKPKPTRDGKEIRPPLGDNAKCVEMKRLHRHLLSNASAYWPTFNAPGATATIASLFVLLACSHLPYAQSQSQTQAHVLAPTMSLATMQECTSYEQTIDGKLETVTHCRNVDEVPVDSDILENTTYLLLDSNTLGKVPFGLLNESKPEPGLARLAALKVLDLSNNRLSLLGRETLAMNQQLEKLLLANNLFRRVPREALARLPRLRTLDLSANRLEALYNDSFTGLRAITVLNLADNRITVIEINAFVPLAKLMHLDLSSNNLTNVDERVESSWPSLRQMQLAGNPWFCDCKLLWLKNLVRSRAIMYDSDVLRCDASPVANARNRTWAELGITHFACPPQLYQPLMGSVASVQVKATDKSASITCQMWSHPKQTVFWKREGKDVRHGIQQNEQKYEISISPSSNFSTTLHIKSLSWNDSGNYACELSNEAGLIRGEFYLQVLTEDMKDGLIELMGARGANFTTLIMSVLGALIIIMIVISTVVYCWHFSRLSKRSKLAMGKGGKCSSKCKTTSPSPLALSLAPSYEPIKGGDLLNGCAEEKCFTPPQVSTLLRQVKFDDHVAEEPDIDLNLMHPTMTVESDCTMVSPADSYLNGTIDMQKPCPVHGIMPGTLTASPRVRYPVCVSGASHNHNHNRNYMMLNANSNSNCNSLSPNGDTHMSAGTLRLALVVKPRLADAFVASDPSTSLESPWSPRTVELGDDSSMTTQNGYIAL